MFGSRFLYNQNTLEVPVLTLSNLDWVLAAGLKSLLDLKFYTVNKLNKKLASIPMPLM